MMTMRGPAARTIAGRRWRVRRGEYDVHEGASGENDSG